MKETAALEEDAPPSQPLTAPPPQIQKHLAPALFGLLIVPFGIVTGYCGVTLPRVLEQQGVTTTAIAAFLALSGQPHSFKFLIEPALDARFRKQRWFVVSIAITALLMLAAVLLQSMPQGASIGGVHIGRLGLMGAVLFGANAAVATSSGAVHALMAITLPAEKKGAAAGWAMAGNLGGYGIGGAIGLFLTQHLSPAPAAISMAALVVATSLPALFIREPIPESHPILKAVGHLLRDAWTTFKSREGWTGLIICLCPVGAGGVANLFSDMASRYQATDAQVAIVNGLFGGLVSALGCVVGGYMADRMNRRLAYGLAGALAGAVALGMSALPMTPNVYTAGCLAYSFANGIGYAAWAAFVLDLMGHGAGVATKHAILAAAGNQAASYMLVFDGLAADQHVFGGILGEGPRAALRADALGTALGIVVLGAMLWVVARSKRGSPIAPRASNL
jgi:MFS family permease